MRSSKIDECFTQDEQAILREVIKEAIAETADTLESHRNMPASVDEMSTELDLIEETKTRLVFLRQLEVALEVND